MTAENGWQATGDFNGLFCWVSSLPFPFLEGLVRFQPIGCISDGTAKGSPLVSGCGASVAAGRQEFRGVRSFGASGVSGGIP